MSVKNKKYTCRLVFSKSRVAPSKKTESVARLELAAAQLGVMVGRQVAQAYAVDTSYITYWTDSVTVLWWLHATKKLGTYVANRVCVVLDASRPSQWKFVPTNLNPADLPSRGTKTKNLISNTLWWQGPSFLRGIGQWPVQPKATPTPEALDEVVSLEGVIKRFGFFQKTSSRPGYELFFEQLSKQVGNIMVVLRGLQRAIDRWLPNRNIRLFQLLIRSIQRQSLDELRMQIERPSTMKKHYKKLNPYIDTDDIIRVSGRLYNMPLLNRKEQCPIILPKRNHSVEHIVMDIHSRTLKHMGGPLHLYNEVQGEYWLFRGRHETGRILRLCLRCSRRNPIAATAQMAPLSRMRIPNSGETVIRAFSKVGIDLAGPWMTRKGRETRGQRIPDQKRYLIIFACQITRAVHLELVYSADADSFLMAFDRFSAVRGIPTDIQTDNGGNFVAGERELSRVLRDWKTTIGKRRAGISWILNPPYTPHHGGNYERLIRSVKEAFYHTIPTTTTIYTDEELSTVFKHIEAVLNQRPLTQVSEDPRDTQALCPQDFLIGRMETSPFVTGIPIQSNLKTRWRLLHNLTLRLWDEFVVRYVRHLHVRNKWPMRENPLREGQVVLVLEPPVQKGHWPLGIIEKVFAASDGQVRRLEIRSPKYGKLVRNCTAVAPLAEVELTRF